MTTESSDYHAQEYRSRSLIFSLFLFNTKNGNTQQSFNLFLQAFNLRIRTFVSYYPSIVLLLACIPPALSFQPAFGMRWAYVFIIAISALIFSATSALRTLQIVLIPALLVAVSAQIARPCIAENPLLSITCHDSFRAITKLRIIDTFASEQNTPEFKLREVKCQLLSFRYSEIDPEIVPERSVKCLLNLSHYDGDIPAYGDIAEVSGIFRVPAEPVLPNSFNYRKYLALQGIHEIIYPEKITKIESGHGFLRNLFRLRDRLLSRITSKMEDTQIRAVTMAMLFGGKATVPRTTKELFMESGIIHLFSVSGTHVIIITGLLLLLFAPFPSAMRYSLTIGIVFLYVLMTGLQGAALRAFTMLGVIFLTRVFSFSIHPFNSLSFAAFILLLFDPASVLKTGMYYSFLSVALLILLARFLQKGYLKTSADFDRMLVPRQQSISKFHLFFNRLIYRLKQCLITSFIVSFGTSALTLLYHGFLPIQGFFTNFLAIPITSFTFIFSFLTCIFDTVPLLGTVFSTFLTYSVKLILTACHLCTTLFPNSGLAMPPVWSVLLFLALCFLLLSSVKGKTFFPVVALLSFILIFWHIQNVFKPNEIAVFYGGTGADAHPTAVFTNSIASSADIINLPDSNTAYMIADFLESRGIQTCRMLIASSAHKTSFDGFGKLEELFGPVLSVAVPSSALNKIPESCNHKIAYDKNNADSFVFPGTFSKEKTSNDVEYFKFKFKQMNGCLTSSNVSIYDHSGKVLFQKLIPYTSKYSVTIQKVSL